VEVGIRRQHRDEREDRYADWRRFQRGVRRSNEDTPELRAEIKQAMKDTEAAAV
jgi:hypothetical protein